MIAVFDVFVNSLIFTEKLDMDLVIMRNKFGVFQRMAYSSQVDFCKYSIYNKIKYRCR